MINKLDEKIAKQFGLDFDEFHQKRLFKPYTSGGRRRKWKIYRSMPTIY